MIVDTSNGKVTGTEEGDALLFAGIPFAAPPVGERRFAAPQPVEAWKGTWDATWFRPAPVQQSSFLVSEVLPTFDVDNDKSEDCLYLNVWTPAADDARRPVLFWLYGGGFGYGSACQPWYHGHRLAVREDVVVVGANYRVGALGFAYLAELFPDQARRVTANAGLLDQAAALQWVRDNIAGFGGDPDNVTVFGESAGGMSVSCLLALPAADGLFHKAVAQSCVSYRSLGIYDTPADATATTRMLLDEVGATTFDELMAAPADDILAAQVRVAKARTEVGLAFQPVVDGAVLPVQPVDAVAGGASSDVAFMVGTTRDELKLHVHAALLESQQTSALVPGAGSGQIDPEVMAAYQATRPDADAMEVVLAMETDRYVRIPSIRFAEAHAPHDAPTYLYLYSWESPTAPLGACHTIELPFLFGCTDLPGMAEFIGTGPEVEAMTEATMGAWGSFARTGRARPDWPEYDLDTRATMVFDLSGCHVEPDALGAERQAWEGRI